MELRIKHFSDSLASLKYLLDVNLASLQEVLDPRLLDGLENGKAQKFEVVIKLCWKCIKDYLRENEGVDAASPKQSIKAFYTTGKIEEKTYLSLIKAIDTRNQFSHIYDEKKFNRLLQQLPDMATAMQNVLDILQADKTA